MRNIIKFILILFICFINNNTYCQGLFSNVWQLGYYTDSTYLKCNLDFTIGNPSVNNFNRPMNFRAANSSICDPNGNLLFYTNGIYIANASHDTMLNGSGLNPGQFANAWNQNGLPIFQGTLILPWPDSSHKYILFHEVMNYDINVDYNPKELYTSIVDMNLDGGLGAVLSKNTIILNDTLEPQMLTACRHANGRDWWVLVRKYQSDVYYELLITPGGITAITSQTVAGPLSIFGGSGIFSPDGNWYATFDNQSMLRIYSFDRCSGALNLIEYYSPPITTIAGGLSFSPNSRYLYVSSLDQIFQYDLLASTISSSEFLVATYDGYYSPFPPYQSTFLWHMLGPDGKIYISSLSSVVDLTVIESPDSAGLSCNVLQHSFFMGSFNVHSLPNFINYNLLQLPGSPCDTLGVGMSEVEHNFSISIAPNPNSGNFKISYLLPQNANGKFEIYDVNGRRVSEMNLPQWSTLQYISLPPGISDGIYNCVISSNGWRVSKKLAVIRD